MSCQKCEILEKELSSLKKLQCDFLRIKHLIFHQDEQLRAFEFGKTKARGLEAENESLKKETSMLKADRLQLEVSIEKQDKFILTLKKELNSSEAKIQYLEKEIREFEKKLQKATISKASSRGKKGAKSKQLAAVVAGDEEEDSEEDYDELTRQIEEGVLLRTQQQQQSTEGLEPQQPTSYLQTSEGSSHASTSKKESQLQPASTSGSQLKEAQSLGVETGHNAFPACDDDLTSLDAVTGMSEFQDASGERPKSSSLTLSVIRGRNQTGAEDNAVKRSLSPRKLKNAEAKWSKTESSILPDVDLPVSDVGAGSSKRVAHVKKSVSPVKIRVSKQQTKNKTTPEATYPVALSDLKYSSNSNSPTNHENELDKQTESVENHDLKTPTKKEKMKSCGVKAKSWGDKSRIVMSEDSSSSSDDDSDSSDSILGNETVNESEKPPQSTVTDSNKTLQSIYKQNPDNAKISTQSSDSELIKSEQFSNNQNEITRQFKDLPQTECAKSQHIQNPPMVVSGSFEAKSVSISSSEEQMDLLKAKNCSSIKGRSLSESSDEEANSSASEKSTGGGNNLGSLNHRQTMRQSSAVDSLPDISTFLHDHSVFNTTAQTQLTDTGDNSGNVKTEKSSEQPEKTSNNVGRLANNNFPSNEEQPKQTGDENEKEPQREVSVEDPRSECLPCKIGVKMELWPSPAEQSSADKLHPEKLSADHEDVVEHPTSGSKIMTREKKVMETEMPEASSIGRVSSIYACEQGPSVVKSVDVILPDTERVSVDETKFSIERQKSSESGRTEVNGELGSEVSGEDSFFLSQSDLDVTPTKLAQDFFDNSLLDGANDLKTELSSLDSDNGTTDVCNSVVLSKAEAITHGHDKSKNYVDDRHEVENAERPQNYEKATDICMEESNNNSGLQGAIVSNVESQKAKLESIEINRIDMSNLDIDTESERKCSSETFVDSSTLAHKIEQLDPETSHGPEQFVDRSVTDQSFPVLSNDSSSLDEDRSLVVEQTSSAQCLSRTRDSSDGENLFLQTMYSMERADSVFNELSQSADGSMWLECTFDLLNADDVFLELPADEENLDTGLPTSSTVNLASVTEQSTELSTHKSELSNFQTENRDNSNEGFVCKSLESSSKADVLQTVVDNDEDNKVKEASQSELSPPVLVGTPPKEKELISTIAEKSSVEPSVSDNGQENLVHLAVTGANVNNTFEEILVSSGDIAEPKSQDQVTTESTTRRSKRLAKNEVDEPAVSSELPKLPDTKNRKYVTDKISTKDSVTFVAEGFAIKVAHDICSIGVDSEKQFVVRNEQLNEFKIRKRTANTRSKTVSSEELEQSSRTGRGNLAIRAEDGESASKKPKITLTKLSNKSVDDSKVVNNKVIETTVTDFGASDNNAGAHSKEKESNAVTISVAGKQDVEFQMINSSLQSTEARGLSSLKRNEDAIKSTATCFQPDIYVEAKTHESEVNDVGVETTTQKKDIEMENAKMAVRGHEISALFQRATTPEKEFISVSEDAPSQVKSESNKSPLRNWKQLMCTSSSNSTEKAEEEDSRGETTSDVVKRKRKPRSGVHSQVNTVRKLMISTIKSEGMLSFYDPVSVSIEKSCDSIYRHGEQVSEELHLDTDSGRSNEVASNVRSSGSKDENFRAAEVFVPDEEYDIPAGTGHVDINKLEGQQHMLVDDKDSKSFDLGSELVIENVSPNHSSQVINDEASVVESAEKEADMSSIVDEESKKIDNFSDRPTSADNIVPKSTFEPSETFTSETSANPSLRRNLDSVNDIACSSKTTNAASDVSLASTTGSIREKDGEIKVGEMTDSDDDSDTSALELFISEECMEGAVEPTDSQIPFPEQEESRDSTSLDVFTVEETNIAQGGLNLENKSKPVDTWSECSSHSVEAEKSSTQINYQTLDINSAAAAICHQSNEHPLLSDFATIFEETTEGSRNDVDGGGGDVQASEGALVQCSYNLRSSPPVSSSRIKEPVAAGTPVKSAAPSTKHFGDNLETTKSQRLDMGLNSPSNKRYKSELSDDNDEESAHPVLCDIPAVRRSPRAKKMKFIQANETASVDSNTEESQGSLVSLRLNWKRNPTAMQKITQEVDVTSDRISEQKEKIMKKARHMPKGDGQHNFNDSIDDTKQKSPASESCALLISSSPPKDLKVEMKEHLGSASPSSHCGSVSSSNYSEAAAEDRHRSVVAVCKMLRNISADNLSSKLGELKSMISEGVLWPQTFVISASQRLAATNRKDKRTAPDAGAGSLEPIIEALAQLTVQYMDLVGEEQSRAVRREMMLRLLPRNITSTATSSVAAQFNSPNRKHLCFWILSVLALLIKRSTENGDKVYVNECVGMARVIVYDVIVMNKPMWLPVLTHAFRLIPQLHRRYSYENGDTMDMQQTIYNVMMNAIECVVCNRRDIICTVWESAPEMLQQLGFSCTSSPFQMANRVAYNHLFNEAFVSQQQNTERSSEQDQHLFQCLKATTILLQECSDEQLQSYLTTFVYSNLAFVSPHCRSIIAKSGIPVSGQEKALKFAPVAISVIGEVGLLFRDNTVNRSMKESYITVATQCLKATHTLTEQTATDSERDQLRYLQGCCCECLLKLHCINQSAVREALSADESAAILLRDSSSHIKVTSRHIHLFQQQQQPKDQGNNNCSDNLNFISN